MKTPLVNMPVLATVSCRGADPTLCVLYWDNGWYDNLTGNPVNNPVVDWNYVGWVDVDDALPDWGLTPVLAMLGVEGENFYTFEVVMFVGGRWFFNSDGSEVKKVRGEPMPTCEEWWPVRVVKWMPIPDA